LIDSNATSLKEDIVLAVTKSNAVAFGLYQQMGFKITDNVAYYVYDAEAREQR
jgi:ribosomal protein S18 acetylase RimI-like enzyme